jgi:hypothetical protein
MEQQPKTEQEAGMRFNDGKRQWGLMDFEAVHPYVCLFPNFWRGVNLTALEEMVKVLEFGAKKYAPNKWKKGLTISSINNSLVRHVLALYKGERFDKESNVSHYGHILCNLMFMSWFRHTQWDDRVPSEFTNEVELTTLPATTEDAAVHKLTIAIGAFMGCDDDAMGYAFHYAAEGYRLEYKTTLKDLADTMDKYLKDRAVFGGVRYKMDPPRMGWFPGPTGIV